MIPESVTTVREAAMRVTERLILMSDDRDIEAKFIDGRMVYQRAEKERTET